MRQYLTTIHTKSDAHQKRFAFLTSLGITLSIFFVWTVVRFSPFSSTETLATDEIYVSDNTANAIAPLDNLSSGVSESFGALKNQFNSVKGSIEQVNLDLEYERMKSEALETNGGNR